KSSEVVARLASLAVVDSSILLMKTIFADDYPTTAQALPTRWVIKAEARGQKDPTNSFSNPHLRSSGPAA
ncbi:hypothetical protein EVAR_68136_1, partial [Eumeta japonica]